MQISTHIKEGIADIPRTIDNIAKLDNVKFPWDVNCNIFYVHNHPFLSFIGESNADGEKLISFSNPTTA